MGRKKKKGGKKVNAKASSSSSSSSSSTAILGPRGAFDKQSELRLLGVESGSLARTGRAAAKSFNTESTQCQSELERYNTFCSGQWTDHTTNKLTPVKMAAFIKATYTESVQRGNWNYATAKQHLVILGWWWRQYTTEGIDADTHTLRYTSVPPLSGNLMGMDCILRAMRIVKGAATTYRETAPVLLKTEQALNRGDFGEWALAILADMSHSVTLRRVTGSAMFTVLGHTGLRGERVNRVTLARVAVSTVQKKATQTWHVLTLQTSVKKGENSTAVSDDHVGGMIRHVDVLTCGIGAIARMLLLVRTRRRERAHFSISYFIANMTEFSSFFTLILL